MIYFNFTQFYFEQYSLLFQAFTADDPDLVLKYWQSLPEHTTAIQFDFNLVASASTEMEQNDNFSQMAAFSTIFGKPRERRPRIMTTTVEAGGRNLSSSPRSAKKKRFLLRSKREGGARARGRPKSWPLEAVHRWRFLRGQAKG